MDYDLHEPTYSDATTAEWSAPQLADFDTDDLGAVADHFLLSASGFPPEHFGDLKLPVVDPDGALNLNALQTAHGGGHSVASIEGLDEETGAAARDLIEDLAERAFDETIGD